ncbi:gigaxonin [Plakobranchus ocellatus]|uniref:Gigaxonin n=1 Tax=Plakobranchus ocellatus TaxID=259542 RepID=A0AAV4AEE5_9GAST|nr:gigaxonin [Plakobranchus ocellatus]
MAESSGLSDEPNKKFQYYEHASKLLRNLNEMRKRPNLCDAVVVIGPTKIPVQKNILSAASLYFRALFDYDQHTTDTKDSASYVVSLDHLGIGANTFRLILDYIFTSEVQLEPSNIQDVLQAADQLLMSDLKDICCEYLNTCINPQNCIGIVDFTSQLSCTWWHAKVCQYLDANFREVSRHEEFLQLSSQRVEELLSRTTIEVEYEDQILDILLRWYRFQPEERKEETLKLLKSVLFAHQISKESMLALEEEKGEAEQEFHQELVSLRREEQARAFTKRGFVKVIVACGGEGPSTTEAGCFETKDYLRCVRPYSSGKAFSDWVDLAPMTTPRTGHGLVEVGGYLYVAGGRDNNCRILNTCEMYDPFKNCWKSFAPMNHARVGFGLVAIKNMIYAIGGSNDMTDPLTSMEVYDVCTGAWTPLSDMTMKRAWPCFVVADAKIYVLGGGIMGKFYESAEVFDTRSLTWYSVSPMRERRCDARAAAVDSDLYVFGGFRRIECPSAAHSGNACKLCGVEYYSEKKDYWVPLQSRFRAEGMCVASDRSQVNGALKYGDEILVVGELDMNGAVHSVRSFNPSSNTWDQVVVNTPKLQSRYQCCMLDLPRSLIHKLLIDRNASE